MGCNGKICQKVVLKTLLGVLPKMASRGAAGTFQTKTSGPNGMKLKNLGLSTSSWKNKAKIDWQNLFGDAASLEVEFDNFFSAS